MDRNLDLTSGYYTLNREDLNLRFEPTLSQSVKHFTAYQHFYYTFEQIGENMCLSRVFNINIRLNKHF